MQHLLLVIPPKCFNLIHVINLDVTSGSTQLLKTQNWDENLHWGVQGTEGSSII